MDGERMKRKKRDDDDDDGDEGEEEEKKMEKFFALIRSMREVRKLIMNASYKSEPPERQKNINDNNEKKHAPARAWRPVFRPEDFMEDGGIATVIHEQAGPSTREVKNKVSEEENKENDEKSEGDDEKERADDDEDLNLKLSL